MSMKRRFSGVISIILLMVICLQGCEFPEATVENLPEMSDPPAIEAPISDLFVPSAPKPGLFRIRYVPDSPVNPITSLAGDNLVLASLLYEGLFTLDSNLNATPVLCESWSTEDNITYTFVIKSDIAMNDGSTLTADDVAYTLKQAMQIGLFVNRLSIIKSVESDKELTITVVLKSANSHLEMLLDIPIIKDGTIDYSIPPGTGPYAFSITGDTLLRRFPQYRDYTKLPVSDIYLLVCGDHEVAEAFDDGKLSLLRDDPASSIDVLLNRHSEMRSYDTTTLQYIGFNMRSIVLRDADVRRAIGSSLDRQFITETIMHGQTLAAPLALSPSYRLYDTQWEEVVVDPLLGMTALLIRAELKDYDNDSYLEYPDGFGGYYKFALDFIVNSDNPYKIEAAHKIADTLKLYGFEIIVRELPWDSFTAALEEGTFDIYYGEITLSADFDLSPLLMPDSLLNYGLMGSDYYIPYIKDFLSAPTDDEERAAAENLCTEINENAPFIPILYKRYVMYTPIGAISGAAPSQSGIFNNFADWTIDLTMLP